MQLNVSKIPQSNKLLIPVADQNLGDDLPGSIKEIRCGERRFKTFNWFTYSKGEVAPSGLFLLALGFDIDMDLVWKTYPLSEKIHLIICSEIIEDKGPQIIEQGPQNNDLPDLQE